MDIKRIPILQSQRIPRCGHKSVFQTCELCYGHPNCCKSHYVSNYTHSVVIVDKNFEDWQELEITIKYIRSHNKLIRLVVEKDVPDFILWAISYDHRNLLQLNVDVRNSIEQLEWATILAHMAERCGVFFIYMIYPIIPSYVQPYHVLSLIDSIRSIPHCIVMLKFAQFRYNKLNAQEYLNVNGRIISKVYLDEIGQCMWDCTKTFKRDFFEKIQTYTRHQCLDVAVCGGL